MVSSTGGNAGQQRDAHPFLLDGLESLLGLGLAARCGRRGSGYCGVAIVLVVVELLRGGGVRGRRALLARPFL